MVLAVLAGLAACTTTPSEGPAAFPPRSFFVFFPVDSAELTLDANEMLDTIAAEARRIAATGVGIVGYASPAGAPSHNVRLSERRAAAVEAGLLRRGVDRAILVRTHHGATPIIGPEIEGQRVEVVVSREARKP
jgi:outer membrane protein OmpA-like peptidoglycan-associated protein